MIITKCDRCGKEMQNMDDVYIVQTGLWSAPYLSTDRWELCRNCVWDIRKFITTKAQERPYPERI